MSTDRVVLSKKNSAILRMKIDSLNESNYPEKDRVRIIRSIYMMLTRLKLHDKLEIPHIKRFVILCFYKALEIKRSIITSIENLLKITSVNEGEKYKNYRTRRYYRMVLNNLDLWCKPVRRNIREEIIQYHKVLPTCLPLELRICIVDFILPKNNYNVRNFLYT